MAREASLEEPTPDLIRGWPKLRHCFGPFFEQALRAFRMRPQKITAYLLACGPMAVKKGKIIQRMTTKKASDPRAEATNAWR